ncbi:class I SAM-dependent methyltransferase [Oculatella sp. LEGE 06141]|uniref:class I SAM-dependent methyltransferase n=1 Tax=Oculatella sp. LEGE 06141 TaxID=1828648 RepID=UPI00187F1C74|nr:class I SAM-dependent methyltransferase [Oculatella sp. LEGE 06141]MBE9179337.1 class I SAM-dependent methyltransferase [Oculatella sp. LEGE 06141]
MTWQDEMFIDLADCFLEILKSKKLPSDIKYFLQSLSPSTNNRLAILDLGCGSGRLFPILSEISTLVVGIDFSPKLIEEANGIARTLPNVLTVCHDMRQIRNLFPSGTFNMIVRAYTSLGYFEPSVEAAILSQCAELVEPGGKLIIDTFNANKFKISGSFERETNIGNFSLVEQYKWDSTLNLISCLWKYVFEENRIYEIPFHLDGYDVERIDALLAETGWCREKLFQDFSTTSPLDPSINSERIVVVAKRKK